MSVTGRNERCQCGSGKKAKRCCGVRRGPSDAELAKAFLSVRSREAARRLVLLPTDELHDHFDEMLELPGWHYSLQLPLPRLLPPELEALRSAIDEDDVDAADERVPSALAQIDRPQLRADLARAVINLADVGRLDPTTADVAIVDLDSPSSAFMRTSLLHAVSVSVGASRTPSGLLVVSR